MGRAPVRPIYYAWNDKIKLARLPLRYFANGHAAADEPHAKSKKLLAASC